jgi:hypothetical protein
MLSEGTDAVAARTVPPPEVPRWVGGVGVVVGNVTGVVVPPPICGGGAWVGGAVVTTNPAGATVLARTVGTVESALCVLGLDEAAGEVTSATGGTAGLTGLVPTETRGEGITGPSGPDSGAATLCGPLTEGPAHGCAPWVAPTSCTAVTVTAVVNAQVLNSNPAPQANVVRPATRRTSRNKCERLGRRDDQEIRWQSRDCGG